MYKEKGKHFFPETKLTATLFFLSPPLSFRDVIVSVNETAANKRFQRLLFFSIGNWKTDGLLVAV